MPDTPPTGPVPPIPAETSAQLLHLAGDCQDNIRLAKAQQWQAGYFTILVYGGLVAAAHIFHDHSSAVSICWRFSAIVCGAMLVIGAAVAGWLMVDDLQSWLVHLRIMLTKSRECLSEEYRNIIKSNSQADYLTISYARTHSYIVKAIIIVGGLVTYTLLVMELRAPVS